LFFKKNTLIWTQSLLMGTTAQSFSYPLPKISNIETSVSVELVLVHMQQKDPKRSTGNHTQRDPSLLFISWYTTTSTTTNMYNNNMYNNMYNNNVPAAVDFRHGARHGVAKGGGVAFGSSQR